MTTVFIHPTADVAPETILGEGTKVWHFAQIREKVRTGKQCIIGKDVYIDRGVTLGERVKIQNGVSVYQGVLIEDDVFIGPHCSFTNDIRPRAFSKDWEIIPTYLRQGCSIGANATVMCGVTVGAYSMIAAGAVVTVDTLPYGLYIGNPARLKGFVSRSGYEMSVTEANPNEIILQCSRTSERLKISFEVL